MAPRTLVAMALAVCIQNIQSIDNIGDMSYKLIRPALMRIDDHRQLRKIEENSPQIRVDDAEVWTRLIAKRFPVDSQKKNYYPKNPESWHRVYARYEREEKEALAEAEKKLKMDFAGLQKEKEEHVSKIVDSRLLPRLAKSGGTRRRLGQGNGSSRLTFGGGNRTNGSDGKSVMKKVRREVMEVASRRSLSTQSGSLSIRPGQIKKAPEGMVNEYRIKSQAPVAIRPPTKKRPLETDDRAAREARLMAAKKQKTSQPVEVDDFDLFGEDGVAGDADMPSKPLKPAPVAFQKAASPSKRPVVPTSRKTSGLLSNSPRPESQALRRVVVDPFENSSEKSTSRPTVRLGGSPERAAYSPPSTKPQASRTAQGFLASGGRAASSSPPLRAAKPRFSPPPGQNSPAKAHSAASSPPRATASSPETGPVVHRKKKPASVFMRPSKPPPRR